MPYQVNIETIVSLVAVAVAILAVYFSNKNTRQQIRTEKLERLYQSIQNLSRYYGLFMGCWACILQVRNRDDKEIQTLEQYYQIRDQKITTIERRNIEELLSVISVLTDCYTKNELKKSLKEYEILMYSFFELVVHGGSIQQEIHFQNGYPDYDKFFEITENLKIRIIAEIKL